MLPEAVAPLNAKLPAPEAVVGSDGEVPKAIEPKPEAIAS